MGNQTNLQYEHQLSFSLQTHLLCNPYGDQHVQSALGLKSFKKGGLLYFVIQHGIHWSSCF